MMQTQNTVIKGSEVKFNSPTTYKIVSKETGNVIQTINIQKGPIKEAGLNGVVIEELLLICLDQLEHFQASDYKCIENDDTLRHVRDALASTRARQYDRLIRNVQGTYNK